MEVLLVLTILVMIAGLIMPIMSETLEEHRIENATKEVHTELANTKLHAVDTGLTYQFRFEPKGQRYIVIPYETDADDSGTEGSQGESLYRPRISQSLPEGFEFSVESETTTGEMELKTETVRQELFGNLPNANKLSGVSWSPPILFFPDGTSEPAMFIVKDDRKQFVRLSVRELTGAVSISRAKKEAR